MGFLGSAALKLAQTILYAITFCVAAVILSAYSYFLAVLSNNDLPIASWKKAVEGISGAACLYLIFAVILTCFLGGIKIFALVAMVLNFAFIGGFIAIAWYTRSGSKHCGSNVVTPLGSGPSKGGRNLFVDNDGSNFDNTQRNYSPDLGFACRLNRAAFIMAIVGIFLFILLIGVQFLLAKKHKDDKQFTAAPGTKKRPFWKRKSRTTNAGALESGYGHSHGHGHTTEPKVEHDTATYSEHGGTTYTGSSAVPGSHTGGTTYNSGAPAANPYQTGPTGPYTNY